MNKIDYAKMFPNFKASEFLCPDHCNDKMSIEDIDIALLWILQTIRNKYNKPLVITSGYRCQKYNDSLEGSVKNSYHIKKKAADFYISGITNDKKKREEIIAFMKTLPGYKYAYHNDGTKKWMGTSIHIEVK